VITNVFQMQGKYELSLDQCQHGSGYKLKVALDSRGIPKKAGPNCLHSSHCQFVQRHT
jgi:hypothetical protein